MKRLLVVLAFVASGALIWGGYVVGRDQGGVHCSGIYVSPDAVVVMHRGAALPAGYGPALDGRPVQAGCLTLHAAASPTKTSDGAKTLPPAFTVHVAKVHSGGIRSTAIRLVVKITAGFREADRGCGLNSSSIEFAVGGVHAREW